MKKTILRIDGMSCSACSNGLEKYLKKQTGIINAEVNLVLATANIEYENHLTIKDLESFVEEAGFHSLGEEKIIEKEEESPKKKMIIFGILGMIVFCLILLPMLNVKIFDSISCEKNPKTYAITFFLLSFPFLIYGRDILKNGIKSIIHRMPNMDSLITIGVITGYSYSIYCFIMVLLGHLEYAKTIYFDSTIFVIYFIKLGRYITTQRKDKTKSAIKELVSITPNKAHLKTNNSYIDVTIDEVKEGDILICLSGERIAVDGEIVKGKSVFDESFITGESTPVEKGVSAKVIAGSINYDNVIEYKAERIGKNSTISEIVRMVVEATTTKAPIQKIIDKICSYFVPIVCGVALLSFIIHLIIGHDLSTAILSFVTVLVVACPCSLGLATPLALVVSVGSAAKKGILLKDSETLELANKIDTVVFDKTGTLTEGLLSIARINNHCDLEEKEVLEILVSIEKYSTHPIAIGINKYAKDNNINRNIEFETEELPGYGMKAKKDNKVYYICNGALLKKLDIINSYEDEEKEMSKDGNTVFYLVRNNKVLATVGLKDIIRKESKKIIKTLKDQKIDVIMLTGDNEITATKIAQELEIEIVYAGVTPKQKTKLIQKLIKEGKHVMMVGDGINDAPSLTASTIGVSVSSGTDIATNSANIVLVNNNLNRIEELFDISNQTIKNIKQNLIWASIYNILMIPIATGFIKGITITPMIACIAMILSSLTVTINSLRLRK